jgi:hypothetical protein
MNDLTESEQKEQKCDRLALILQERIDHFKRLERRILNDRYLYTLEANIQKARQRTKQLWKLTHKRRNSIF